MPAGETPCTIALYVRDDLVDSVQPGDRVQITGIYRAVPLRVNPRTRNFKSVYKTYVEALHFKKADTKRLYEFEGEEETSNSMLKHLTAERIAKLKQLSQETDIYDKLARAIAPDIFENDDIKKGILLQLFGGTSNSGADKSSSQQTQSAGGSVKQHHSRSEINILLCGDPGRL